MSVTTVLAVIGGLWLLTRQWFWELVILVVLAAIPVVAIGAVVLMVFSPR